jgi:FlaA1/EpsC-like NDP-sugar epimerase
MLDSRSAIFVSDMDESYRIVDLAQFLVENAEPARKEVEWRFTGLRPGEKIFERMTSDEETLAISSIQGLREVLYSPSPTPQQLNAAITEIDAAIHQRDLGRLLQAIISVVPDYVPSARLQQHVHERITA